MRYPRINHAMQISVRHPVYFPLIPASCDDILYRCEMWDGYLLLLLLLVFFIIFIILLFDRLILSFYLPSVCFDRPTKYDESRSNYNILLYNTMSRPSVCIILVRAFVTNRRHALYIINSTNRPTVPIEHVVHVHLSRLVCTACRVYLSGYQ